MDEEDKLNNVSLSSLWKLRDTVNQNQEKTYQHCSCYSAIFVLEVIGSNGVYKRHGGSVPFSMGCQASGGVCIPLAEPAQINPRALQCYSATVLQFEIPSSTDNVNTQTKAISCQYTD